MLAKLNDGIFSVAIAVMTPALALAFYLQEIYLHSPLRPDELHGLTYAYHWKSVTVFLSRKVFLMSRIDTMAVAFGGSLIVLAVLLDRIEKRLNKR